MKVLKLFIVAAGLVLSQNSYSESVLTSPGSLIEPVFLPVDQAFKLSVHDFDESIELRWLIAPGYYLYRQKLGFKLEGADGVPEMRSGDLVQDEYFGEMEVFYGELVVSIPIKTDKLPEKRLFVNYQGCADAGLCYPPQKREFLL